VICSTNALIKTAGNTVNEIGPDTVLSNDLPLFRPDIPRPPRPPTRRERVTAIITSHPPRDWSGHDLAILLGVKPRNMLTQLGEWARLGFFNRTGFGTYRLSTPSDQTPLTDPPDP